MCVYPTISGSASGLRGLVGLGLSVKRGSWRIV